MLIRVDMRETELLSMFQMNLKLVPDSSSSKPIKPIHAIHSIRSESLPVGDVILSSSDGATDYIVFERKSLQDLAASIRDGRYKEQSLRLQAFPNVHSHNVVYIVEGDFSRHNERFSKIGKGALQSAMCSLNYYKGFSVVRTMSIMETHDIINSYANKLAASPAPYGYYHKPPVENAIQTQPSLEDETDSNPNASYCSALKVKQVKCENITPQNIGEIMLCNIPGVSNKTAAAIMKKYTTLRALMDALKGSDDSLADIRLETQRKLSKQCIQNIYNFLMV
jgi:ERCC4-type nuclease